MPSEQNGCKVLAAKKVISEKEVRNEKQISGAFLGRGQISGALL